MKKNIKTILAITLLIAGSLYAYANRASKIKQVLTTVKYTPSDKEIINPERGMFTHHEFFSDKDNEFSLDQLKQLQAEGMSLVFTVYVMRDFRDKDISAAYLNRIKRNLAAIRTCGMKAVVRFCYTYSENDKPWDAPWEVTKRHIAQLKPILIEYSDVIAILEAGFVGVWGEWYYTDNYVYQPNDVSQYAPRKQVLEALLDAMPTDRFVAVRYPRAKLGVYGIQFTDTISRATAYNGSNISRTSFHNDCFLADADDMGTFQNIADHRKYWMWESRYVPMGGETCAPSDYCEIDNAYKEFAAYHWTYLNKDYHPDVLSTWEKEDFMTTIRKKLGYRFVLTEGTFTGNPQAGQPFQLSLQIRNEGWGSPFNPRSVEIIFQKGSEKHVFTLEDDPRFWMAGETADVTASFTLPADMSAGEYEVYLNLPDPRTTLHDNPAYSIQLANEGVWQEAEGYNKLCTVNVGTGNTDHAAATLWEGQQTYSNYRTYPEGSANVTLDAKAFASASTGDKLTITFTEYAEDPQSWHQVEIWDTGYAHALASYHILTGDTQCVFTLDDTLLTTLKAEGCVLAGTGYTVTKICLSSGSSDTSTAVRTATTDGDNTGAVFSMNGTKVTTRPSPTRLKKGIYITNGKKVVVK